jgi:hypothetical protein
MVIACAVARRKPQECNINRTTFLQQATHSQKNLKTSKTITLILNEISEIKIVR